MVKMRLVEVICKETSWMVEVRLFDLQTLRRLSIHRLAIRLQLNTKTSYSWLTKPKTPKLNAKTGRLCPPEPP